MFISRTRASRTVLNELISRLNRLQRKPWLRTLVAVLPPLVPFFAAVALVKAFAVNTPFNDDWTFLEDWVKWTEGRLSVGDLCTAHMEHRVTVPRVIALIAHWIGGEDLRWQNVCTLLLIAGTGWNLSRLLKDTSGRTIGDSWLPLTLISMALFSAIQWQGLLWPILFEAYIPIFAFSVTLRLWLSALKPWPALALSALAAMTGMWSFGNGIVAWALVPPLIWACRGGETRSLRWQLTGAWVCLGALAAWLYSLNFVNAAPAEFSYGQGHEVTAGHSIVEFLKKLPEAPRFVSALLGSHLSRGLHLDNLQLAEFMGWVSLVIYFCAVLELWRCRTDESVRRALVPWLMLGAFSIGSALLIAAGRLWLTRSGSLAITGRYISHAIPLSLALIALVWIIGRRWLTRVQALPRAGMWAAGFLAALLTTQWIYGARMMALWEQSRLEGKALVLFIRHFRESGAFGAVSADSAYGLRIAREMDKLNLLNPRPRATLSLQEFSVRRTELSAQSARFEELTLSSDGKMTAKGYSELPSGRPADLVFFTTRTAPGQETIFGFTALESLPRFYYDSTKRDREFLAVPAFTPELTARWAGPLTLFSTPARGAVIDAWAFDARRMIAYHVADRRIKGGKTFPKNILPNSDN